MSRVQDALNRLELVAKKLGMSIEEALEVLEGKHPTHGVVQVHSAEPGANESKAEKEAGPVSKEPVEEDHKEEAETEKTAA